MLKRIDDGLARGEAMLAGIVLIAMVAFAAVQVVVDNSAVRMGWSWAQEAKLHLGWIDNFLERATVILAFVGASLAVHANKHIAIDALVRILPARVQTALRGVAMIVAGVTCYFLARVFYQAALGAAENDAKERALEFYLLGDIHICDASASALADVQLSRPDLFCAFRSFLANLGLERTALVDGSEVVVPAIDVPDAILRFVVPAMLLLMLLRFVGHGVAAFWALATGRPDPIRRDDMPVPVSEGGDSAESEVAAATRAVRKRVAAEPTEVMPRRGDPKRRKKKGKR